MIAHPVVVVGILGVLIAVLILLFGGIAYIVNRLQGTRMSRSRHIIGVIGVAIGIIIALKVTFFVIGILQVDLDKLPHPKPPSTQDKQEESDTDR